MKLLLATVLVLSGMAAQADQCAWNSASDADSARKLIAANKEVMFFCQNCSDEKPSYIAKVSDVKTKQVTGFDGKAEPYREVVLVIDGKEVETDLAYLYVRTASNVFANVAQLVGCPNHGAVTFIETTNKNKKIQHYYDAEGNRQNLAETVAKTGGTKTRVPASPKK